MRRALAATALIGFAALSAQGAAAGTVQRAPVAGVSRAASSARRTLVRQVAASAPVSISVAFAPRNPALLAKAATAGSVGASRTDAGLRSLFAPSPAEVASVTAYLRTAGFRSSGGGILSRSFTGPAAAVTAAFGTSLDSYRAAGVSFRAPASTPTLPASMAAGVTAVDGLDTYPVAQPMAAHLPPPLQVVSSCSATGTFPGGYEPAVLASAAAYDYQPLMSQADEGQGNTLALIEFSGYDPKPVATYQSCYKTTVPITDVNVNGGTTVTTGADEVQLDEEVAAAAAPGLDGIQTYIAPNGTGFAAVVDRILADRTTTHVDEISISWGACEAASSGEVPADDAEFQLAAAAGVSVFAASGDNGSADCEPFNGSTDPAVDYPASDPWVTGVGGTTLDTSATGAGRETTWGHPETFSGGGGGGGVSTLFAMPAWQAGTGVIEPGYSSAATCGQTTTDCREVPDVALDANPDSGYILRVTNPQGTAVWAQGAGTSAAAPLMAAITADANTASVAAGGARLGYANPFVYAHPGVFRDITLGTNSVHGIGPPYPAGTGYDMATGLGSPDGAALSAALVAASAPQGDATAISAIASSTTLTPGAAVSITGSLTDSTNPATLLGGRQLTLTGSYTLAGQVYQVTKTTTTAQTGSYTFALSTADARSRFTWQIDFAGGSGAAVSHSTSRVESVLPTLTTGSSLKWSGTQYTVKHGTAGVTVSGLSTPGMTGAVLTLQTKAKGAAKWVSTATTVTVGADGRYSVPIKFAKAVKESIRFSYAGSATAPWLSATSPARLFVVT